MPNRLAAILFALALLGPATAQAKIDLDWSHTSDSVSPELRRRVEKAVDEAARLFQTEPYADLGKLDIRAHERTVLIQVRDFGPNQERGLHLTGAVFINAAKLDPADGLRLTLVHEMTHAYDFLALAEMTMDYLLSAESGDARVAEKRAGEHMRTIQEIKYQAEKRAHDKTLRFAREHGLNVPGDIE
ncbi:MAG: hypothetical protein HY303_19925 [Candidatus Wallbacteria bacterium]|nr:hypothetical protein [Candidatus Wallbacteria bacterium]